MVQYKQGYVFIENSQLTGEDIVGVISGFRHPTDNRKLTGNNTHIGMLQTTYVPMSWIVSDIKVSQGRKVNGATCGNCPIKRECYVGNYFLNTITVQVRKLLAGNNKNYEYLDNASKQEKETLKQLARIYGIRLGAYGNPSSVSFATNFQFIDWIYENGKLIAPYTTYDHEVLHRLDDPRFAVYKDWVMASISAPKDWGTEDKPVEYWLKNPYPDWVKVLDSGMSSYCAISKTQPLFPEQKIHCPFILGDLSSKGCAECKLCCGTKKGVKHIVEYWH